VADRGRRSDRDGESSGLDPELEAVVMALELTDWVGAMIGLGDMT
jgi:hypothetical protein